MARAKKYRRPTGSGEIYMAARHPRQKIGYVERTKVHTTTANIANFQKGNRRIKKRGPLTALHKIKSNVLEPFALNLTPLRRQLLFWVNSERRFTVQIVLGFAFKITEVVNPEIFIRLRN